MPVDLSSETVDKNSKCLWKLKREIWNLIDIIVLAGILSFIETYMSDKPTW